MEGGFVRAKKRKRKKYKEENCIMVRRRKRGKNEVVRSKCCGNKSKINDRGGASMREVSGVRYGHLVHEISHLALEVVI